MTEWAAKRFWDTAGVAEVEGGWGVTLDSRRLSTPGKLPLILPTRTMAEAIAAEWAAQSEIISPLSMPVTRSANSAVERVTPQRHEVAAMLSAYGETDLLCYRAEAPEALTQRQAEGWDPLLDWLAQTHAVRLIVTTGIIPAPQEPTALATLARIVGETDAFEMTALHDLITLTGSLVLGLAVAEGVISAKDAWGLSRIDEAWQIEQWGEDTEALRAAEAKEAQVLHAERFLALCRAN